MRSTLLLVVACALGASGCLERGSAAIGPNVGYGQEVRIGGAGVSSVDVLFVIDSSGSMSQEQSNLAIQIPALVRSLASPPLDAEGRPQWNPVEEMRIGITTTDVGTGSITIERSGCLPNGDDGALRGGVFQWALGSDLDAFADRVRVAVDALGIEGCAFEQPLEAAARAIARAPESGFPSDDGLLAVIVVTDEDDCSVEDDDVFFTGMTSTTYNVHCGRNTERLTPVSELLDAIRGERDETQLIFAAIAGFPVDAPLDISPSDMLARDDMQFREEGTTVLDTVAVCGSVDDLGKAAPARRLGQLAQLVPETVLTTICTDDFGPAIAQIGARIGQQIPGVCLVRELPASVGDQVPCQVEVTLPRGQSCEATAGHELLGFDGESEVCTLAQVPGGSGSGWYYDPANEECAQLVITDDAQPPIGASIRAECFFPLELELGELCARSSQCGSGYCDPYLDACAPLPTATEPEMPPTGG